MSTGTGLRRRRSGYSRNRSETGRWSRYSRSYSRRRTNTGWGARRTGGSGAINAFARLGFVARGIVYIVIGVIASVSAVVTALFSMNIREESTAVKYLFLIPVLLVGVLIVTLLLAFPIIQ